METVDSVCTYRACKGLPLGLANIRDIVLERVLFNRIGNATVSSLSESAKVDRNFCTPPSLHRARTPMSPLSFLHSRVNRISV